MEVTPILPANYEYNGTAGQITGTGLSQNIPNSVTVNLSGVNTLTLTANTSISGSLTLTSGVVDLNTRTLTLGTGATSVGVISRSAGFLFNGTFRRWFTTTAITIADDKGLFPMGTSAGDYRPLWVAYSSNLTTAGLISLVHSPTYPATFVGASHNDASWGNTLQGVSNSIWTISTSTLAFNGSTGMVRFGGTGFGSNTLTDLDASLLASVIGTHGAATNVNTTIEVNRTALTTANIANGWRIGTRNTTASPLPITLLDFTAEPQDDHVLLNWITLSEKDSHHFTVEKSFDGVNFDAVKSLPAAGNSSVKRSYSTLDHSANKEISYYRLKQTDFDGTDNYYKIIAVPFNTKTSDLNVYPNPTKSGLLNLSNLNAGLSSVELINALGQQVYYSAEGVSSIDLTGLPAGVYYLRATSVGTSFNKKIVIEN